jgi:hypothetical protein
MSVTKEQALRIMVGLVERGIKFPKVTLKSWPVPPFEEIDTYIDFEFGSNLYASEKLSDISIEDIFEQVEKFLFSADPIYPSYMEWKKSQIRDIKLENLGI